MGFSSEKFLSSGTYIIVNCKHDLSIAFRERSKRDTEDVKWTITLLSQRKWTIESSSSRFSIHFPNNAIEYNELTAISSSHKPHQWVIKQREEGSDTYLIYSPSNIGLFWSIPDARQGVIPLLNSDNTDESTWWRFKKVGARLVLTRNLTNRAVPIDYDTPLQVLRPTIHQRSHDNRIAITIPPGWLTSITAISIGQCINMVRVQRKVHGFLESQDFISPWDCINQVMTLESSASSNSHPMHAVSDVSTILILDCFRSRNAKVQDPLALAGKDEYASEVHVHSASRPTDMRTFPDYETITILDGQVESGLNAIITIHMSLKVFVDLNDPGKPTPGTVQEGYDVNLDRPRPRYMDEYLENYNIIFIVDDSGSMSGEKWEEVREALSHIGNEAMQYDADGIDIYFLNSRLYKKCIKTQEEISDTYARVQPNGGTPTGTKLNGVLNEIISTLDAAAGKPEYGKIKPFDIIVLTDGCPTDDPAAVIQRAARRLDHGQHHPNAVGIQFVQIGNDHGADMALRELCKGPVRNMVDTVPNVARFTPERLKRVLLGAMHPSIRARITV